jgi:hypothetical protein
VDVEELAETKARARFAVALALSLLIVLGGIAWTWKVGQANNKLNHRLAHVQEALESHSDHTREASAR